MNRLHRTLLVGVTIAGFLVIGLRYRSETSTSYDDWAAIQRRAARLDHRAAACVIETRKQWEHFMAQGQEFKFPAFGSFWGRGRNPAVPSSTHFDEQKERVIVLHYAEGGCVFDPEITIATPATAGGTKVLYGRYRWPGLCYRMHVPAHGSWVRVAAPQGKLSLEYIEAPHDMLRLAAGPPWTEEPELKAILYSRTARRPPAPQSLVRLLEVGLRRPDPEVRRLAAYTLWLYVRDMEEAGKLAILAMSDDHDQVRSLGRSVLEYVPVNRWDLPLIRQLISRLDKSSSRTDRYYARSLRERMSARPGQ